MLVLYGRVAADSESLRMGLRGLQEKLRLDSEHLLLYAGAVAGALAKHKPRAVKLEIGYSSTEITLYLVHSRSDGRYDLFGGWRRGD